MFSNFDKDTIQTINKLEDEITEINNNISELKDKINRLSGKKDILMSQLRYEKAAYYTIDFLPSEIKKLDIYVPKKFHIIKYINYPYYTYMIAYDNHIFEIIGRVDFNAEYTFKIDRSIGDNFCVIAKTPLHLQIYYSSINSVNGCIINGEIATLTSAINNASLLLRNKWLDDMAFGISLFHYWLRIYNNNEAHKYPKLHHIFEKYE